MSGPASVVMMIRAAADRLPDAYAAPLDGAAKTVSALVEALKKSLRHFESQHALLLEIGSPEFVGLRDEMVAALLAAGEGL